MNDEEDGPRAPRPDPPRRRPAVARQAARCPRCGAAFGCGAAGPAPCPCTAIALGADLQAALRDRFTGCLCPACLRALARGADVAPPRTGGDDPPEPGAARGPSTQSLR